MKVETNIITSIWASLIGRTVILVIMYVKTFKADIIVYISDVIMCLSSHWLIFFSIRVSLLRLAMSLAEIKRKISMLLIVMYISRITNAKVCERYINEVVKSRFFVQYLWHWAQKVFETWLELIIVSCRNPFGNWIYCYNIIISSLLSRAF